MPVAKANPIPTDAQHHRFYTVSETARMLRTSAMTVYRAVNAGEFPAIRIRGRLIIPARVIDALIDAAVDRCTPVDTADGLTPIAPPPSGRTACSRPGGDDALTPEVSPYGSRSITDRQPDRHGEVSMPVERPRHRGGVA
jgi:excisionase family DNA binding protein